MERVKAINTLADKVSNKRGHNFLYDDFESLLISLEADSILSKDEIWSIDWLVRNLLSEANLYSGNNNYLYYPLWSVKCFDCAVRLFRYIPDEYNGRNVKEAENIARKFLSSPILFDFICTESYRKYIEELIGNDHDLLWKVAENCFSVSNCGRRPRDLETESKLYSVMMEGYNLANTYIAKTKNMSHFPDWFAHLNIEYISRMTACTVYTRYDEQILELLDKTLDIQISLLKKWLEGDAKAFLNHWSKEQIKAFLELTDDGLFYYMLDRMCSVGNCQKVKEILEFYTKDDEIDVKSYAERKLAEYSRNSISGF